MTTSQSNVPSEVAAPLGFDPPAGSSIEVTDLGAIGCDPVPRPSLGGFVYPKTVSAIAGEPGIGKSYVACALIVEALRQEHPAIVIDYEDVAVTWKRRLQGLGLDDQALADGVRYLRPGGELSEADLSWLKRLIGVQDDPLVVIDSLPESLVTYGFKEDSSADVTAWFSRVARPLARAGASVVLLDHVTKGTDRGRWARGSGAKLAAIDGCAVMVKSETPFAHGRSGSVKLTVSKDRQGAVGAIDTEIAEVWFTAEGDTVCSAEIRRPPGLLGEVF